MNNYQSSLRENLLSCFPFFKGLQRYFLNQYVATIFFMRIYGLYLISILSFSPLFAQLEDNFSDGDFSNNPEWEGDVNNFIVNDDFELQLNAPDAGSSMLFTPVMIPDSAIWELYFKLDFPTSTANQLRIYLQSEDDNLLFSSGYFLEIGESGSDDAFKFYRQDAGGAATPLASGTTGALGGNQALARLRVERTSQGFWSFHADYTGGFALDLDFEIQEDTYPGTNAFFGFYCKYSSTRKDKFFFDDISIKPLLPDTQPPEVISVEPFSDTNLLVLFDEKVEQNSVIPSHFSVNNGIGIPLTTEIDFNNKNLVHLTLNNPLQNQTTYTLNVSNIADESGNLLDSQDISFSFLQAEAASPFDILINEFMADPTPPIGLPNAEFVELYNRSDKVINLDNYGFDTGSSPKPLPSYLIFPDTYVILCDEDFVADFQAFGDVIGIADFPALVNSGDELTLSDANGIPIHTLNYSIDWYGDVAKEEGGWSLEMISHFNICEERNNWLASENLAGGTPGQNNSVFQNFQDEKSPDLIRAFVDASNRFQVKLFFSERLDPVSVGNISNYAISNNIEIQNAFLQGSDNKLVTLNLNTPLETQIVYEITISPELTDCLGNPIGIFNTAKFGVPEPFEEQDVIINEILFNPSTGGVDFIEVYNRSSKIFNLSELIIGNLQDGVDTIIISVNEDFLLFPQQYAVISESSSIVQNQYTVPNPENLLQNDLPGFDNESGNVTLIYLDGISSVIVDAFDYEEDFHHPLLDDVNGVSLERINPDDETQNPTNWHSAAQVLGFATPTYQNSQFIGNRSLSEDIFWLNRKTFSPDFDGFQDFLQINYQIEQTGYVANIKIFDAAGRFIADLVSNELLALEGSINWDGTTRENRKANVGIYILWIQIFSPEGDVKEFKKTCVLAE